MEYSRDGNVRCSSLAESAARIAEINKLNAQRKADTEAFFTAHQRIHVAKKDYACDGNCGGTIHKGERYTARMLGVPGRVYSESVRTGRFCAKCKPLEAAAQ